MSTPQKPRSSSGAERTASMSCWSSASGDCAVSETGIRQSASATSAALLRKLIQLLVDLVEFHRADLSRSGFARPARVDVASRFAEHHALFFPAVVEPGVD